MVKVENLYKVFPTERYHSTMYRMLKRKLLGRPFKGGHFNALQNINFEAQKGEVIGIVGNNGAGKTTLLKVIAGLYRCDGGKVYTKGKMTLLSGFGLGMNDELSVEENIYLYGIIYGMERERIKRNFHEIIEWAELQKFTGAKLKTLSSGMRTRLAFSVTRHIQTDIFMMDEALSAGDKGFRDKCDRVFEKYKNSEMILIVATHNTSFVKRFCTKVLWLHKGEQKAFGEPENIVSQYLASQGK